MTYLSGAYPRPACITHPKKLSSISVAGTPAASRVPFVAQIPSSGALTDDSYPIKEPIGVLFPSTITTLFRADDRVLNAEA